MTAGRTHPRSLQARMLNPASEDIRLWSESKWKQMSHQFGENARSMSSRKNRRFLRWRLELSTRPPNTKRLGAIGSVDRFGNGTVWLSGRSVQRLQSLAASIAPPRGWRGQPESALIDHRPLTSFERALPLDARENRHRESEPELSVSTVRLDAEVVDAHVGRHRFTKGLGSARLWKRT